MYRGCESLLGSELCSPLKWGAQEPQESLRSGSGRSSAGPASHAFDPKRKLRPSERERPAWVRGGRQGSWGAGVRSGAPDRDELG